VSKILVFRGRSGHLFAGGILAGANDQDSSKFNARLPGLCFEDGPSPNAQSGWFFVVRVGLLTSIGGSCAVKVIRFALFVNKLERLSSATTDRLERGSFAGCCVCPNQGKGPRGWNFYSAPVCLISNPIRIILLFPICARRPTFLAPGRYAHYCKTGDEKHWPPFSGTPIKHEGMRFASSVDCPSLNTCATGNNLTMRFPLVTCDSPASSDSGASLLLRVDFDSHSRDAPDKDLLL